MEIGGPPLTFDQNSAGVSSEYNKGQNMGMKHRNAWSVYNMK
jgi:hypothetical protein